MRKTIGKRILLLDCRSFIRRDTGRLNFSSRFRFNLGVAWAVNALSLHQVLNT